MSSNPRRPRRAVSLRVDRTLWEHGQMLALARDESMAKFVQDALRARIALLKRSTRRDPVVR